MYYLADKQKKEATAVHLPMPVHLPMSFSPPLGVPPMPLQSLLPSLLVSMYLAHFAWRAEVRGCDGNVLWPRLADAWGSVLVVSPVPAIEQGSVHTVPCDVPEPGHALEEGSVLDSLHIAAWHVQALHAGQHH